MANNQCGVCEEVVADGVPGVQCGRCDVWHHMACVGLQASTQSSLKVLSHDNVCFLCDGCKAKCKEEWGAVRKVLETKGSQTKKEESKPEKSVQTEGQEKPDRRAGPKVKKMVRRRAQIHIIGDSIVRKLPEHVQMNIEDSGCTSIGGAKITELRKRVQEEAADMEDDGLLVLQGGGNGLVAAGCEGTVQEVVEAVKAVKEKKMSVAVVGVIRRPREGQEYEDLRRATNRRINEELLKLKLEWLKDRKGNVSFLDVDAPLSPDCYARDGVHLNDVGLTRVGRKVVEWVRARSLRCPDDTC